MPPNTLEQTPVKISDIPEKYPKQWVTVKITQRDLYGLPLEGKVMLYAKSKTDIVDGTKNLKVNDLYVFYTGRIDDDVDQKSNIGQ